MVRGSYYIIYYYVMLKWDYSNTFQIYFYSVGGGFPGNDTNYTKGLSFADVAAVLGSSVDKYFPPHVKVIAEPGRYFVSSAFTLSVGIIARRTVAQEDGRASYMCRFIHSRIIVVD